MREYLFRGKPIAEYTDFKIFRPELFNGGFIHGSLVICNDRYYICTHAICSRKTCVNNGTTTMIEVIPQTVGQFTSICDKNCVKIFEGDIVRAKMDCGPGGFLDSIVDIGFKRIDGYRWNYFDMDTIEVIGNVYDNFDLLEDKEA